MDPRKVKLLTEYVKTLEQESEQKTQVMKELLLLLENQQKQIAELQEEQIQHVMQVQRNALQVLNNSDEINAEEAKTIQEAV